jgi:hypothetical protein
MALTEAQKAQKRQDAAFEQMIIDSFAEKGENISPKKAHQIHLRDKKKSDTIRLARWKQYKENALIYRMRTGKETGEAGEGV